MRRKNESLKRMRKGTKKKIKTAKEVFLPILDSRHSEHSQTLQKFKVPDFRDISVTLTAPHRHFSVSIFFLRLFAGKAIIVCLLNNGFSQFYELLDNLTTHIA